jgi:hypothetical protein
MKFIKQVLFCLVLVFASYANAFPTQPVKIITNLPVGSAPDVFVRKLSQVLEAQWKVPVSVENKPGASGLIALDQYLKTPNNGHTIFYGDFGVFVTTPVLFDKENLIQQMRALTIGYNTAWVIVTPANIRNLQELQTALRQNPRFGSWGIGSGGHFCGQELSAVLQVPVTHVPYKDHGPWFVDTSNGLLAFGCTSVGSSEAYFKSGKFNYVAMAANQRDAAYPMVPTVKELTGHHFETGEVFSAFYAHRSTPDSTAQQLETDLRKAIQSTEMVELVKTLRGLPMSNTNQEMTKLRDLKVKEYKQLIKKYNITVD